MGFRAELPRASIRSPRRVANQISIGVHGGRGRWLVNGASGPLVAISLDPPTRARVYGIPVHAGIPYGIPVRLRELLVSVDDPDAVIAQLG